MYVINEDEDNEIWQAVERVLIKSKAAWKKCLVPCNKVLQATAQVCSRKYCKHVASQSKSYRLCDIDINHGCCAEGWRASVPGLHHQRPLAVLLLGDVLYNLHWFDEGLQLDLPSVWVDVKRIVRISRHDGVLNEVVWRLCIVIHCLYEGTI